jgi:predicted metal-dependent phosphotriesterase family hydrolase
MIAMVQGGFADHIAIGLDMALTSMWRHFDGGPGLVALPDVILPRLHNEGFSESVVSKLVGENLARFLVLQKPD